RCDLKGAGRCVAALHERPKRRVKDAVARRGFVVAFLVPFCHRCCSIILSIKVSGTAEYHNQRQLERNFCAGGCNRSVVTTSNRVVRGGTNIRPESGEE